MAGETLEESVGKFSKIELMHMADSAADYYGIPQDMMRAQIRQESGWNPNIPGSSGEIGLSQFMPATAKSYFPAGADLSGGPNDVRRDPRQSIDAQARYMLDLHKQAGESWEGALMGYNTGRTFPTPKGREYVSAVLGQSREEQNIIKDWATGAAGKRRTAAIEQEKLKIEQLKDPLAATVASFQPLKPIEEEWPEEFKYHVLKHGETREGTTFLGEQPITEKGVTEPPWFNPPMLAANILSGGITAGPMAAAKMVPGMLLGSAAGSAAQELADIASPKWGWVAGLATDLAAGMLTQRAVDKWAARLAMSRGLKGERALELSKRMLQEVNSAEFQTALQAVRAQKALPAPGKAGGEILGPEQLLPTGELAPGFTMKGEPPVTVRRPAPTPVWETGNYPEVWVGSRGQAEMTPETFQRRADMAQGFVLRPGGNLPVVAQGERGLVPVTPPEAPPVLPPVSAKQPSIIDEISVRGQGVAPKEWGTDRPYPTGRGTAAAGTGVAPATDAHAAARQAFKYNNAQEFTQAMGGAPPPPGVADWGEFYSKIRGAGPAVAVKAELKRPSIEPNSKINDITAAKFWDLVVAGQHKQAVDELKSASTRFTTAAVDDEFGINKAWDQIAKRVNLDITNTEDRAILKQMVKTYENSVYEPFKGGMVISAPLGEAAPSGAPPAGKPYLIASMDDPKTGLHYEWHDMPGESGRLVYQEMYRGDQLVNKGAIVSGPQERVEEFLNSDPSGRFQAAQKFQPISRGGVFGDEIGSFGGPKGELPAPTQLARDLVKLTDQGLRPEQALSQLAQMYGRRPREIVDVLQGATAPSVIKAVPETPAGEIGRIVKQRVDKGVTMPPVYEGEARQIKALIDQANDPNIKDPMAGWATWLGRNWTVETSARTFANRMPPFIKEWYYNLRDAAANSARAYKENFVPELDNLQKSLPSGSSKRIGAYMAAQDPTGAATLKGMGVAVPELTSAELKAVEWFQKTWSDFYTKLNEARVAAGKAPFEKVENYYTFMRKFNIWRELGFNPVWADINDMERAAERYITPRTTPFRFAKKREGGFDPINIDAFAVMRTYARSAFDHIHLSPWIGKYREQLGNISLDNGQTTFSIRDDAPHYGAFLTDWLNNVGGKMNVEFTPKTDRWMVAASRNNAFATLSGNVASALKQPGAIRNTVVEIGPRFTKQGIADNLNPQLRAYADSVSSTLATREYDASVKDAMALVTSRVAGKAGEVIEAAKKTQAAVGYGGLKPLEILDYETARCTWLGAYRQATETLNLEGRAAIRYADDVVVKTQGSASRWDVAPFQRNTLGRVLGPFQTFMINEWGWITHDVMGLGNPAITNKDAFKKVAGLIAATSAWNIVSEDILGVASPFPRPVKTAVEAVREGKSLPSTAWEVTKEMGQMVPVVGGGLRYGSTPLGATVQLFENLAKGGTPAMPLGEIGARAAGVPLTVQTSKLLKAGEGKMTTKEALFGRTKPPEKQKNPWGGWND